MRTRREPPICQRMDKWLNHHCGKGCLAPCTGQDYEALKAFAHLCNLYAYADVPGREAVLDAMACVLRAMQSKCWPLAKKMIPCALDWGDEPRIWSIIDPERSGLS